MKKTLSRSKTFESDLTKLDRRLTRTITLPSFGSSTEFDYKRDTKYLAKILKQCITAHTIDLDFILNFFSSYNCEQRIIIVHELEFQYNYKLVDLVLERPDSPRRSCTLALSVEPIELYVRHFRDLLLFKQQGKTIENISTTLVEILLTLNNSETLKFKETYENLFDGSLEDFIKIVQGKDTILTKLLIELLDGKRYEESDYSISMAKEFARRLYEAGEGTPGIDYDIFIKIFTHDTFSQLSAIFDVYEDKYGRPIQEAIQREFQDKNDIECFQDIVEYTRSPSAYFSRILRQAFEKKPIDYVTIIRIIIGHQEKDLGEIKLEYSKIYNETVDQTILNRIDIMEIKRLLVMIITNEKDLMINETGHAHFDHINNSTPISSGTTTTTATTTQTHGMRRNRSHEAFDKFVNVFKTMRPH